MAAAGRYIDALNADDANVMGTPFRMCCERNAAGRENYVASADAALSA